MKDLPTDTTESTPWKKLGYVHLLEKDRYSMTIVTRMLWLLQDVFYRDVLESADWLTDNIVNATQVLLQEKYRVPGLQSTGFGRTLSFDVLGHTEFVQVLHSSDQHWIVVSTIGCKYSHVKVYDSMYSDVPTSTREQICALLASSESYIHLDFVNVQLQSNCCDCGLFALAFSTALCEGYSATITIGV